MSKVINLAERLADRKAKEESRQIEGWLIWLHCPKCNTIEYTELRMPGGRVHKCGTLVEEEEIPIDVRAEFTISQRNLDKLNELEEKQNSSKVMKFVGGKMKSTIKQLRAREEEYQQRLQNMTSERLNNYPEQWDPKAQGVEITVSEPIGLEITAARQGHQLFTDKK